MSFRANGTGFHALSVIDIASLVGYLTKVAAIEMMFKPIDFRGAHIDKVKLKTVRRERRTIAIGECGREL